MNYPRLLRVLALLMTLLFPTGCQPANRFDPDYDPAFPTMAPVRDLKTVGNLRAELLWESETVEGLESTPLVAGDVVYAGGSRGVYAFDTAYGKTIWHFETDMRVSDQLAVAGGMVYVGSFDGQVYALDAASGKEAWRYDTGTRAYSPAVTDGIVYVVSGDDYVYALDGASGELIWRVNPGPSDSAPVVADSVLYVGDTGRGVPGIYALDASSGELLWSNAATDDASSPQPPTDVGAGRGAASKLAVIVLDRTYSAESVVPASERFVSEDEHALYIYLTVVDDVVFLAGKFDGVHAFNANGGEKLWHFPVRQFGYLAGVDSPPVVVGGTVYVGAYNRNYNNRAVGSVHALDAASGEQLWKYETAGGIVYSPDVEDDALYISTYDGHVYALDAASGELFWYHKIDSHLIYPLIVVEGVIYLGTHDGLTALRSIAAK